MKYKIQPDLGTWEGAMPLLIYILEAGSNEGREMAKKELMRLAKATDETNRSQSDV